MSNILADWLKAKRPLEPWKPEAEDSEEYRPPQRRMKDVWRAAERLECAQIRRKGS